MIDTLFHLDPVTGLLDRASVLLMAQEMARDAESGRTLFDDPALSGMRRLWPVAAIWIDIDRFRQVNESLGHERGDEVIALLASRLRERLGGRGELGRMGADEFVCLVPGVTRLQAEVLAGELMQAIGRELNVADLVLRPAAGIGIAIQEPGEEGASVLQRADLAKAVAKQGGAGRCVVAGSGDSPQALAPRLQREDLAIEQALHEALEHGGLALHYQPILDTDGQVREVEALMRCLGPEPYGPARFVPVAEKTGLIVRIGEWSLMQGCLFARRMRDAGTPLKVAVNVSRVQLLDDQFSLVLHAALLCAGVGAESLQLELTESLFMDVSPVVQANLAAARELGVGLAMDDFGTGYSCLANLKDIPASKLKLDRAFVQSLPHDARSLAVVRAMTRLGVDLGMTVTAEGAETDEQAQALWSCGVNQIQGYCVAQPMDEPSLRQWLAERTTPEGGHP